MTAGGIVIDGNVVQVPGLRCTDFVTGHDLHLDQSDYTARTAKWVRQIIVHTTEGIPTKIGTGSPDFDGGKYWRDAWAYGKQASGAPDHAGAHLVISPNGTVACLADLATEAAYHAGAVNQTSIGIEVHQSRDGTITIEQLHALTSLLSFLTRLEHPVIAVPPTFHAGAYKNAPLARMVDVGLRLACCGVFGHRDVSAQRGHGDAGDDWRVALALSSWAQMIGLDYSAYDDVAHWKEIQKQLGFQGPDVDGVPGPITLARYRASM